MRSEAQPEKGRAPLQQERGTASAVPLSCRLRPRGGRRTAPRTPAGRACAPRPSLRRGAHLCGRRGGRRQPSPSPAVRARTAVGESNPESRRLGRALRGPAREGSGIALRPCSRRGGRRQPSPSLAVRARAAVEEPQRGTPAGRACAPRSSTRRGAHLCSRSGDGVSRPLSCRPPPRGGGRTAPGTPAGRVCAPRSSPRRGAHLCSRIGGRRQPSPLLPSAPARRARKNAVSAASHSCRRTPPRACTPPPSAGSRCRA